MTNEPEVIVVTEEQEPEQPVEHKKVWLSIIMAGAFILGVIAWMGGCIRAMSSKPWS